MHRIAVYTHVGGGIGGCLHGRRLEEHDHVCNERNGEQVGELCPQLRRAGEDDVDEGVEEALFEDFVPQLGQPLPSCLQLLLSSPGGAGREGGAYDDVSHSQYRRRILTVLSLHIHVRVHVLE